MFPYSHLHNHTQYSVLQSTTEIDNLVNKAVELGMPAVALTDHSNLYGAYKFVNAIYNHPANKQIIEHNKGADTPKPFVVKGVVGCELFVCKDYTNKTQKDNGYSQVFLAKKQGWLSQPSKLSSISFVDGFYYVPRVDKVCCRGNYKEGLIALSGGLKGELSVFDTECGRKASGRRLLFGGKKPLEMTSMSRLFDMV